MRASFPAVIDESVSESDRRPTGWAGIPLVAVLAVVALLELTVNRIVGHLLQLDPFVKRTLARRALSDARLFLYELTAVLSAMMLGSALARITAYGTRYRVGARVSFALVGFVVVVLSALGAVAELPPDLFFHLHLSFTFLALLVTMTVVASRAPGRVRLGTLILFLPVALHFAARFSRRMSPVPELTSTPLELEAIAQATLAAAAVVAVPCFAARRHGVRFAIGLAALFVGASAVLVRVDWESAARVAAYGFGVALPIAPWALCVYLLALGGFVFTVATLLSSRGEERLRGWGLLLFGIAGLDQQAAFQITLAAVGLLCLAESVVRGGGQALSREAFENVIRRGAAAVGAPQVTLTGTSGYETVRLHAPPTAGMPITLTLSRHGGLIASVDVLVGESLPRHPPFTLERRDAGRLGPRADGPAIDTGDAAFDAKFVTRDRRGLNAQLLDEGMRARLDALCIGWLGVWPQRGVHYRARTISGGDDALPLLIELLQELATRAS
ncbi:MAG: hypothetical protein JWN44_1659 [Myxococcales bacterium]|nr:hypothetical protein [Myxococcales bacterium]